MTVQATLRQCRSDRDQEPIKIRAAKCKFGPLTARYDPRKGDYVDVEAESDVGAKRGVALGLDGSHNRDYKVQYASDPVLIVHSGRGTSHQELKLKLHELGLWMEEFEPVELPRTGRHNDLEYAAGFKSLPRSANRIDRFQKEIREAVEEVDQPAFSGANDIEAFY